LRALLLAILINGLVPAFGEAAEAVVHYAKTGHVAHATADEHDLGDLGREHGCGSTEHRCDCCPNLAVVLAPAVTTVSRAERTTEMPPDDAAPPGARSLEPPLRPPIA
jgi:hypothetical protein